jgi:alanyl-tRNA synthetase
MTLPVTWGKSSAVRYNHPAPHLGPRAPPHPHGCRPAAARCPTLHELPHLRSHEIRQRFLGFFEERGHHLLPNASLIPSDDPSLLFTVAGMVPLKPYISGERTPPSPRLTSCQKVFRGSGLTTDDIASVGDCIHHTFFEMLGNWSIGDYFKQGAIEMAWELLTQGFGLEPERLWPSIYPDDGDSLDIWINRIGVADRRVARLEDNWWQAGPTGPCGYDSEIYFDRGGPCTCGRTDCTPQDECGGDRWIEIWNLVFMEFDQAEGGSRALLPKRTVDTGMGLERIAAVLQGVRCDYDTDLFAPIIAGLERRAPGGRDAARRTRSLRILADHVRGATFLIAEGILPGNEGRGYVLRRVIRRAALHARRVGLEGGLSVAVADVVTTLQDAYPELAQQRGLATATIRGEEEVFARTVEAGVDRLEAILAAGAGAISGEDAFRLYDTFGLPVELTVEMAEERGLSVDRAGFDAALQAQRERGRASRASRGWNVPLTASIGAHAEILATVTVSIDTEFAGYDSLRAGAAVIRIGAAGERESLGRGEEDVVFLDVSPFYAEAGGQVGDTGTLSWEGGRASVLDCLQVVDGPVRGRTHRARVETGTLRRGETVNAEVDPERRAATARHHSATHLLHRALREILGETVVQRGSFVGPEHATFDFSFPRGLTPEEIQTVERRINAAVRDNLVRNVREMPVVEAQASGAMALFGEKYGELVRVVDFGGWSRELCGGTHVGRSGDIGAVIVLSETSIGQGTRRIEMVAGGAAVRRWEESETLLRETARTLKARLDEVPDRVARLLEQNRELQRRSREGGGDALTAALRSVEVGHAGTLALAVADDPALGGDDAVALVDRIFAERLGGDGIAAVFGEGTVCAKVGGTALTAGIDAGRLVRTAAQASGGKGGGQPGFGRGGFGDPGRRAEAVAAFHSALEEPAR